MRDYIKEHKAREKYNLSKFQQGGKMDWTKSSWYNSPIASIIKIADPTGISSYGDVYNAWTDNKFDYQDILAPIGALPLVGKFGKLGKAVEIAKNPKIYSNVVKVGGRTLKKSFNTIPRYSAGEVTAAKNFIGNNKALNTLLLGTRIANLAGDVDNGIQLATNIPTRKHGGKINWIDDYKSKQLKK